MRTLARSGVVVASFLGLALTTIPARAEEPLDERVVRTAGPKRALLQHGAVTLGISYTPALVVGITSPMPEDRVLVAPVAGPWLDLAERDCVGCSHETVNQVLLVADGVVQGVGALEIVGAFLFWETSERRAAQNAFPVRLIPQRVSGGYGLRAVGQF